MRDGNGRSSRDGRADEIIQSVAREVEVTRRLYRSGESEYLIDGQMCRLRDVHDLLMDTGLGAKAYAIIEQGKIGLILSSRPTDRRQLIEEAAGVTKYKARRRSAELKLEAAQQNLTRIDDIVFEVEKQRGTLKRQAAKARRYQKLRDELRRWEKVLFARKYRQLAETIDSARGRSGRGARARVRRGRAGRRDRIRSGPRAHRAGRGRIAARRPRAKPRTPASSTSTAASSRSRSTRSRSQSLGGAIDDDRPRSSTRSNARREPARGGPRSAARGRGRGRRGARPRRGRRWRRSPARTRSRTAKSKGSRPTSRRRAAKCSPRSIPATALRHALEHASDDARPRGRNAVEAATSKPKMRGSSPSASRRIAPSGRRRAAPRAGGDRGHARRAVGARVRAGQRAHRARVARALGARARARARRPRSAADIARGARRGARRTTATPRATVLAEANGQVESAGRGRRLPRGRAPATSAPSKRAWATCCST